LDVIIIPDTIAHMSKLSESFTKIASLYNEVRPGYPNEMYSAINMECSISTASTILEVGAGHGIATNEIFQRWGSNIIAVEPGKELCGILNSKFNTNNKISIINSTFEDIKKMNSYDFIFSGTAFHWINKGVKYQHSSNILKKNGKLVLFWNNYSRDDNEIFDEIQSIYRKYYPDHINITDIRKQQKNKIMQRKLEIIDNEYFNISLEKEFPVYQNFTANEYIGLLKTFSNNSIKNHYQLTEFYNKIEDIVLNANNSLKLPILVNSIVANKL